MSEASAEAIAGATPESPTVAGRSAEATEQRLRSAAKQAGKSKRIGVDNLERRWALACEGKNGLPMMPPEPTRAASSKGTFRG